MVLKGVSLERDAIKRHKDSSKNPGDQMGGLRLDAQVNWKVDIQPEDGFEEEKRFRGREEGEVWENGIGHQQRYWRHQCLEVVLPGDGLPGWRGEITSSSDLWHSVPAVSRSSMDFFSSRRK